jgi:hypothetical protein
MTLSLRPMNRHAQLMGWSDHWGEDDYVVLDQGRSVGRIYKETKADSRWCWFNQHERFRGGAGILRQLNERIGTELVVDRRVHSTPDHDAPEWA